MYILKEIVDHLTRYFVIFMHFKSIFYLFLLNTMIIYV